MRILLVAGIVLAVSAPCDAGLQSAMTASLGSAGVVIRVNNSFQLARHQTAHAPEGTQFIDPQNSTFTQPAYLSGPEFSYNPRTGAATISAPPMLGPGDAYGLRSIYRPSEVHIVAGDWLAAPTTPAVITRYHRTAGLGGIITGELDGVASESDDRPFEAIQATTPGYTITSGTEAWVQLFPSSGWSGATVSFEQLFVAGLTQESFYTQAPANEPPISVTDAYLIPGGQPGAAIMVDYYLDPLYSITSATPRYTLLATARIDVTPEPAGTTLIVVSILASASTRKQRVASSRRRASSAKRLPSL
ncbi:hypothetical protein Pla123a_21810 [Posidoniimonas polymericola]|uniref:Uncharacterized protein n=1 Tax=Posidoniimonas polymericola TaxID=2528002 RepID=A0A5C5YS10_9BACT|nr:hypothetical protein [Posidoniimonas polymericola]TWT77520.1 hypothetical protein Pla123a_21810 [Posidoniimonas polymericola]